MFLDYRNPLKEKTCVYEGHKYVSFINVLKNNGL